MKIKILIADDHSVVRKGLKTLLQDDPNIEIIGEGINGLDTIDKALFLKPAVILLDITMPDMSGIEVTKILSEKAPLINILIFSMHASSEYIVKAVQNGAKGYLLKDTDKEEIIRAIKVVAKGKKYFPPEVSEVFIDIFIQQKSDNLDEPSQSGYQPINNLFTPKENQILALITKGKNSREIGIDLSLSIRTIEKHRSNIMRKAGATNTIELINKLKKSLTKYKGL